MKRYVGARTLEDLFQRVVHQAMAMEGMAFRAVGTEYANRQDLLSGEGTRKFGGRWTPPGGFAAVHASLDVQTALAESLGTQQRYGISVVARLPLTLVAIAFRLHSLIDLTDEKILIDLELTRRRLMRCRWQVSIEKNQEALTQALGRIAFERKVEGLLVPSAQVRKGKNLVVFPDNLWESSSLAIQNIAKLPSAEN